MNTPHDILAKVVPSPASYLAAARQVRAGELGSLRALRLAVLSTVSAQLLEPFLIVEGARRGLRLTPWFAPFGQLEMTALESTGALYAEQPDVIVVLARPEELLPELYERIGREGESFTRPLVESLARRLETLLRGLRDRTSATILIANFAPPENLVAGLADATMETSQVSALRLANDLLAQSCRAQAGTFVFDYARVVTEHGLRGWHDARMMAMARQPWSVEAQIAVAAALARTIRAAFVAPAKCLVVDADNTLWGGVVGEEGLGGIALGADYPGNVYQSFQKHLRALKDRGVLLALVSKNEEADVLAVLDQHPDTILRRDDFAAWRINWREKSANLREIAAELNVGLDALVLFDDNPFEREEVRQTVPEALVLEVPADPLRFIDTIDACGYFDQLAFSAEDRGRAEQYQQQQARAEAGRAATSPGEFLASLGMIATIGPVDAATLPRVAQLLAKTNQFNLTTRRHTAAETQEMMQSGAVALWLRLADRFGDHGLVGVAIAKPSEGQWVIDAFLLSCRVIGRGVETALLAELATTVRRRGGATLIGEYLPTAKNALVREFYAKHLFTACGENRWLKRLSDTMAPAPYMEVRLHE
jgi:FkbH-like protein